MPSRRRLRSVPCAGSLISSLEELEPRRLLAADGLQGAYFNETDLTDLQAMAIIPTIDFPDDQLGDDAAGFVDADDQYSIRWAGWVRVEQPGDWTFITHSNDGVRLSVNDTSIIENWDQHTSQRDTGQLPLETGWHPIRLEYFQDGGTTDIRLLHSGPGQPERIIPQSHLSATDPNQGNPIADAGRDRIVVLPAESVRLSGNAQDNGSVTVARDQISGPNAARLSDQATVAPRIDQLIEGTYEFELTVTDDDQNQATDRVLVRVVPSTTAVAIHGELKQWHKTTIDFQGPSTAETDTINPFTDYRLDVTFQHPATGSTYVVPGYYAADGNAAHTSSTSGNIWRVHFAADIVGTWNYTVSFRTGANVAAAESRAAGEAAGYFDGAAGTFTIHPTDKTGRDFRSKGRLQYVGEHYLRFAGSGEYFLKQGADAPENLLATKTSMAILPRMVVRTIS